MLRRKLPPQELLKECFDYDPGTGLLTWRRRPLSHFKNADAARAWNNKMAGQSIKHGPDGRTMVSVNAVSFRAYRVIWKLMTGEEPDEIDHINGDPGDDRFCNLRNATRTQNAHNTGGWRTRDLPKGVMRHRAKYGAQIIANGQRHVLGTFETPEAAHAAYCEAAARLHGAFANFGPHQ